MRFRTVLFALIILSGLAETGRPAPERSPSNLEQNNRVRFKITAVELQGAGREVLSDSLIEGPPGVDFAIKLQSKHFRMNASFLTELTGDRLMIRADLETKRLLGMSERNLPIYEEDQQRHSFDLTLDEQLNILPFGGKDDLNQLRIEIIPSRGESESPPPSTKPRPLFIKILKQASEGLINIAAFKRPHHFNFEAELTEDGHAIARTGGALLLDDQQEFAFSPSEGGGQHPGTMAVAFRVDRFISAREGDEAVVGFDLYRVGAASGVREALASNWAGVCRLDEPFSYDVTSEYGGTPGRKYELRFVVRLAQ
ncbi:MAG TPA: hypothetical protein VKM94_11655 [Blastocatellia bacterium]|nr:hypothetical protein [Blastocatellia bacterium]